MRASVAYITIYIIIVTIIALTMTRIASSSAAPCDFGSYGKVIAQSEGRC